MVLAGVAVLATLGLVMAPRLMDGAPAGASSIPERHPDGGGPLGSGEIDPNGAVSHTFSRSAAGGVWTLGIRLCLVSGDKPATLDSVGPTRSVGQGYRYIGSLVRRFTPAQADTPIGSIVGYPPNVSDALSPAVGFVVRDRCQGPNPDTSKPYTELLLGFARGNGSEGGGWYGVDVGYNVGGKHHVVELRYDILMCGTAVTTDYCATH